MEVNGLPGDGAGFKNSATNGFMPNSVGIRSSNNNTFNVQVSSPFFEDFAAGMIVRGWGWIIDAPFGQSAAILIDLVAGGGHSIRGMVLQGVANNAIGTGVHCRSTIAGNCELRLWRSVGTTGNLEHPWIDDTAGKLAVTAA